MSKLFLFFSSLLIIFIAWFINLLYDTNELFTLPMFPDPFYNCQKYLTQYKGFEDLSLLKFKLFGPNQTIRDINGFISIASDHSHFKFVFGKSMREVIKEKVETGEGKNVKFVIVLSDGKIVEDGDVEIENLPNEFFPHGIATYSQDKDKLLMLVVNHKHDVDTVELFKVLVAENDQKVKFKIKHVRTLQHEGMINLNDCVFYDEGNIFCTNWRSHPTGSFNDFKEVYLRQPNNFVLHCHYSIEYTLGSVICSRVATGLIMPNGIEISKSRKYLFVVDSILKALFVYKISKKGNEIGLSTVEKLETFALCDNANWFGDHLLLACHPKGLTFIWYSKNPATRLSPSEIVVYKNLNIEVEGQKPLNPEANRLSEINSKHGYIPAHTLLLDPTGQHFSAASGVALLENEGKIDLWLGSVHDYGLLKCKDVNFGETTEADTLRELFFM